MAASEAGCGRMISSERRSALLSQYTSRRNKVWLAVGWRHAGVFIEWRYQGEGIIHEWSFSSNKGARGCTLKATKMTSSPGLSSTGHPRARVRSEATSLCDTCPS
jgi:hypothetical protein